MKTGEMNTDLEYKGYTVRLINSIKDNLDTLGNGITISKAPGAGTW